MKIKVPKPVEGEAFAVPMQDGRYAIGVIARVETKRPRKPYGIYVYFFAPYNSKERLHKCLPRLTAKNYVARLNTSALDIYDGIWTRIGMLPEWNKPDWPFPEFYVQNDFTKKFFKRVLSETDLISYAQQYPIDEIKDLEEDTLHGSESASNEVLRLTKSSSSLDLH
jgi:Immunity protein 26